jgi:hypothetical protein
MKLNILISSLILFNIIINSECKNKIDGGISFNTFTYEKLGEGY